MKDIINNKNPFIHAFYPMYITYEKIHGKPIDFNIPAYSSTNTVYGLNKQLIKILAKLYVTIGIIR